MDDHIIQSLEKLFYQKIMLYHDLLHCFEKEQESLITIDMDTLWGISKQKEEMCTKIHAIRQEIMSSVNLRADQGSFDLNRILALIPFNKRAPFQNSYLTLVKLRSEIEALRKGNMIFVDDSLQFLDEMISVITGEGGSRMLYNERCHLSKSGTRMLLSREA